MAAPQSGVRSDRPQRPAPVQRMIGALIEAEVQTSSLVQLVQQAVREYERAGLPTVLQPFEWGDKPPAGIGVSERGRVIAEREAAARELSSRHGLWCGRRDRIFYTVVDWRAAVDRVRRLIPTVTKWTDRQSDPEIDRWSAGLRDEVSELGGVIHRDMQGDLPSLEQATVDALRACLEKLRRRTDDLKRVGPERIRPLSLTESMTALAGRESWVLDDLPPGVTEDVLRVLDADGLIELRPRIPYSQSRYPGDRTPPRVQPWPYGWVSPTADARQMGTWEQILEAVAERTGEPPELRLTQKAKAELARARVASNGSPPARRRAKAKGTPRKPARAPGPVTPKPPGRESPAPPPPDQELAELERTTPPLDRHNGAWVANTTAAELEGVKAGSLTTYRAKGIKNATGNLGRDIFGRVWRRTGTDDSHPWYLKITLRSIAKRAAGRAEK